MRNEFIKNMSSSRYWWPLIVLTIAIRLYLTGDQNILALNSPHDEFWYINSAFNKVWGGNYDQMTLIHLPVYSFWLACLRFVGIPARLGIDVIWLLGSAYLSYAINNLTRSRWIATLLFVVLIFHPYTVNIFNRALSETLLTVLSAVTLAAAIEIWNCHGAPIKWRTRGALFAYACGFAAAYHTRPEGIVLVAPVVLLLLWSLLDRRRWWHDRNRAVLAYRLFLAPLITTLALGIFLCAGNYLKWNVWATYELAAPGYVRTMGALNSIDVGATPRQITVTQKMLSLAYRESPTFAELKPSMEGTAGKQWIAISSPYVSVPGEIGDGWFYWALRDAAAQSGWYANAKLAEKKYTAVANELDKAFASGRLKKRFMISSFIDSDYGKWLPELPTSLYNVSSLLVRPEPEPLPSENASTTQFYRYAKVTGRRGTLEPTSIAGWVIAPIGSVLSLAIPSGVLEMQRIGESPRSDVPGGFAFSISSQAVETPSELQLQLPSGERASIALSTLEPGTTATMKGDVSTQVGIDKLESASRYRRSDRWFLRLNKVYGWFGCLIVLAAACALTISLIRRERTVITALILITLAAIGARIALLGVLDASSWSGAQPRYLLPLVPFFASLGALSIYALANTFSSSANSRGRSETKLEIS
jgi:hypothetical protein